jgi:methyl-accepting chemotaxis protein
MGAAAADIEAMAGVRARNASVTVIVVGAGLVPLLLCAGLVLVQSRGHAAAHDRQVAQEEAAIAAKQLNGLFEQWRSELLIAANNDVLTRWYTEPNQRPALRPAVNRLLVQLNSFYPDLIDEACFIDLHGLELARQVNGVPAAVVDLSADESGNEFFHATFDMSAGHVHQHGPYVSPDSGRWVISNSTPIVLDGRKVALLHFEASLEGLRQRLIGQLRRDARLQVVDSNTNKVVIDTRGAPIGKADFVATGAPVAGVRAMEQVRVGADNQNHWRVQLALPATAPVRSADLVRLALLALVTGIGLVLLARSFRRRLLQPIARMTEIARRLAGGDLTHRIDLNREDEVGLMALAMNEATGSLQDAMGEVATQADELTRYAERLHRISSDIVAESATAATRSQDVLTDARDVTSAVGTVADGTDAVRASVSGVFAHASEASKVADNAVAVAERVARTVDRLDNSSLQISDVLKVIAGIADQTNLLALNATIEAARAGAAGKGFAIVASEVKELARETGSATDRINTTIASLRADATDAVGAIAEIQTIISAISSIQSEIGRDDLAISSIQSEIVTAVEDQQTTTRQISEGAANAATSSGAITEHIATVAQVADTKTAGAIQAREAAEQLATMASRLHDLLGRFTYRD